MVSALCHSTQGDVYVGTSLGRVFKLQNQIWIPLAIQQESPESVYPIKNIVSCRDRVFFVCGFLDREEIIERKTSLYVWEIVNDTIVLADVPTDIHRFAEDLDSKNGNLLVCGKAGAIFYNGTDWEILIDETIY